MISIVMLAHNKIEMTRRALNALFYSSFPEECEILCVDNGSTDPMNRLADEFCGRAIPFHLVRNHENFSFSKANNLAVRIARGSILIFVNNDVVVEKEAVWKLAEVLERDRQIGIAGAKLLCPENGLVQHAGIVPMLWGYASNYGVGADPNHPLIAKLRSIYAVTGALVAIDRKLFEMVGGFDERYRYGYEDVDICLKSRQAKRNVIYVPEAIAYHAESSTLNTTRDARHTQENYRIFRNRWNFCLEPLEKEYLLWLETQSIRRVAIFGTGLAARGLFRILSQNGISVVAFTSSLEAHESECIENLPVVALQKLETMDFDRLMVASQFFFGVQSMLAYYDPERSPIFPVLENIPFCDWSQPKGVKGKMHRSSYESATGERYCPFV